MKEKENRLSIGRINGVEIFAVKNEKGEDMVPIKPICTVLGISSSSQREKIQEDDFYESTELLSSSVGADGKCREMFCISVKDVYGWLASINAKNVAPEAKEAVRKYRRQCYDLVYDHFFARHKRQAESNQAEAAELERLRQLIGQEKEVKSQINETKKRIDSIRAARLDDQPSLFD